MQFFSKATGGKNSSKHSDISKDLSKKFDLEISSLRVERRDIGCRRLVWQISGNPSELSESIVVSMTNVKEKEFETIID